MKIFTIGYGGRTKESLLELLRSNGINTVVDVRLRPDRASMGIWVKAKTPDKGIQKVLSDAGIGYLSLIELGNLFLDFPDWQERYKQMLTQSGDLLLSRLTGLTEPICLLCAEKKAAECHRSQISDFLAQTKGYEVMHLE